MPEEEEEENESLPHLIYLRREGLQKWWGHHDGEALKSEDEKQKGWTTCMAIKMSGMNHVMEKLGKVKMKMNNDRQSEVKSICICFVFHCPWGD